MSARKMRRSPWASWAGGLLTVCLWATAVHADGLHCKVFNTDDLEAAWWRLVKSLWPERTGAQAPRVTSHKDRPQVELAIRELLAVLQFVDPYNYADDSPAWMSTEDGRQKAREQARKILLELGRGAAGAVWQALELECRFEGAKDGPQGCVKAFRTAQRRLQEAQAQLESERRQDAAYRASSDEIERLRPKVNTLACLEQAAAEGRRLKVAAQGQPERLKALELEQQALDKRIQALGDARALTQKLKDLRAALQARAAELAAELKVMEKQTALAAAKQELDQAAKRCAGLGQGLLDDGDLAMVTSEDFTSDLRSLLIEMGPEALPPVATGARSTNPAVKKVAEEIQAAWRKPVWARPFALAAADGKTQVALAAARFLKEQFRREVIPALLDALEKAPAAEQAALFAGLKAVSGENLPDDLAAWKDWWEKTRREEKPKGVVPDE